MNNTVIQTPAQHRLGLVFSGGGARAAYQVGCLYALGDYLRKRESDLSVVVGTSLGALNGLLFSAAVSHGIESATDQLASLWRKRTFENTFRGSLSRSFLRSVQIALLRYRAPGPSASAISIFDPAPLEKDLDEFIDRLGGIRSDRLGGQLRAVAVMSTIEGASRKPLLLTCTSHSDFDLRGASFELKPVTQLRACHGLASAALPSVLPSVDLDLDNQKVRLVDGGISDNHPVDPAARLGAEEVILLDASGRRWWADHYGTRHDTRPRWEIAAGESTYCVNPVSFIDCSNKRPLGPILKQALGNSTRSFVRALGPVWPIFRILKVRMGEDLAYEVVSYVALCPEYSEALIEVGRAEMASVLEVIAARR